MTSPIHPILIGIDVGTSGVRAAAVSARGEVIVESRAPLYARQATGAAHEQDPAAWWEAVCQTLQELRKNLEPEGGWREVAGISITSTSGSLVLIDSLGDPVRPAMLYDDGRASAVAMELNARLPAGDPPLNASFSLAKALWVRQFEPFTWERAARILHPADWLTARLTGIWGVSDYSNALKLGYDPEKGDWMAAVALSEIPSSMFPRVVAPGEQVGTVSAQAAEQTGLPSGIPVIAGASDGLASLIGSGACQPGHANTTLGTTLVWKVLSTETPRLGAGMYCHYLPGNLCVPGAASNTGPGSLRYEIPGLSSKEEGRPQPSPEEMDTRASRYLPTSVQCYLLGSRGERFPFLNPQAETFFDGDTASPEEAYAAQLQSLACVERWGYERLEAAGVEVGDQVYSAGSAAMSPVFSQLRANVLNRHVVRTANPNASFGAAILAAGRVFFGGDLTGAMKAMTRVVESHAPEPDKTDRYAEVYRSFRIACARHGLG